MEEDISDDIYGDLGDFEVNEKLKENCQKIEDLTDQLNQSKVAIADLQTKMKGLARLHRELEKNSSSLLLTARVELSRKDRNIGLLQQKIDNRAFRRPNNCSIGIQTYAETDVEGDPSISHYNGNDYYPNGSEQLLQQPVNDLSKFRIPKKNPFARHEHDQGHQDQISACHEDEKEHAQLPKKNPHARRFEEKDRLKGRRDEIRNNRRPYRHNSKERRDCRERSSNSSDRKRDRSGNSRKRGRSSCDETDRHAKRRTDLSPNRQRSRSRPTRNEEKLAKAKSPKKNQPKREKGDRVDEMKSRKDSATNLKEKDLEAILIARKKILDEIDRTQQPEQHEKSSEAHRKLKSSNIDDPATMATNQEAQQSKLPEKASKEHRRRKHSTNDDPATMTASQEAQQSELPEKASKHSTSDDTATVTASQEQQQSELPETSSKEHRRRKHSTNDDPATVTASQEERKSEQHEKSFEEHRKLKSSNIDDLATVTSDQEAQQSELPEKASKHSTNDDPATVTASQEERKSELPEKSSKERRRRKQSTIDDPATVTVSRLERKSELPEKLCKGNQKRKSSNYDDFATMTTNQDGNEDLSSANDASSAEVTVESKNPTEVNPKNSNVIDASPETIEVFPVTLENSIQELELVKATDSANDLKLCSFVEGAKAPSELTNEIVVAEDVPEMLQLLNDEKSNSPMDIDYELMEHRLVENETKLAIEETDRNTLVECSPKRMTPIVNEERTGNESFTAMEVAVHKGNCLSSTLNSSQERHVLSKSSAYTVEDAGFEIRIFLTKKRKKNKNAKATS